MFAARKEKQEAQLVEQVRATVTIQLEERQLSIPMLPTTAQKALELTGGRASVDDFVALIERDNVLAARLLQVANSPALGTRFKIMSVRRGVTQLGIRRVRDLLFSVVRKAVFPASTFRQLHAQYFAEALAVGCACDQLGDRFGGQAEQRFLYGLLHNIGKGVVLETIARSQRAGILPERLADDLVATVVEDFHAAYGAALANQWRLPKPMRDAITHHNAPESVMSDSHHDRVIVLTHVAKLLTQTYGIGFAAGTANIFESGFLFRADVQHVEIDALAHATQNAFEQMRQGF